jgi:hypothetical protein
MQTTKRSTEPPIRVGSRYEQVARFLGKEVSTSFEVTQLRSGSPHHDLIASGIVVSA